MSEGGARRLPETAARVRIPNGGLPPTIIPCGEGI